MTEEDIQRRRPHPVAGYSAGQYGWLHQSTVRYRYGTVHAAASASPLVSPQGPAQRRYFAVIPPMQDGMSS